MASGKLLGGKKIMQQLYNVQKSRSIKQEEKQGEISQELAHKHAY